MALNVVDEISRYNLGRENERLQMKYRRMRASDLAFVRGSCHLFYARLPQVAILRADKAELPQAWACGDLHAENFGSYLGDSPSGGKQRKRLVYFDINDFDEAALAPCSWDVLRLAASLQVGLQGLPLTLADRRALSQALLAAYGAALREGKAYWIERETARGPVGELLEGLQLRKRKAFLDDRTVKDKKQPRRLKLDGKKTLAVDAEQRREVLELMRDFAQRQAHPASFEVLDVARRIAGTGSLGLSRYVVLVAGKGKPGENLLLDLKQVPSSSLLPQLKRRGPQPAWADEAERVVSTQRCMQAVSPALLQALSWQGRPFTLRVLQPSEDRIELAAQAAKTGRLLQLAATMGALLAWAQLRSAGRRGACPADALSEFGQAQSHWQAPLLRAAETCAAQARQDAAAFNKAYDAGAFAA